MGDKRRILLIVLGLVLLLPAQVVQAVSPPPHKRDPSQALSALAGGNGEGSLASNLKTILLAELPDPLFEDERHWGKKKKGPLGKMKNDGRWWKVRVTGRDLRDTLVLDVRDVQKPSTGKKTFTLFVMFDATVLLERQTWKYGARLYSGSTRARVRLRLTLECEVQTRLEKGPNSWLPEVVFRLHVAKADFGYDNLVVEHTAGVSGEAAKVLGDAIIGGMKRWKPSLERKLIDKANAAIIKAGDNKEVKLGLSTLFK
jgi:hypothetical protein